MFILKPHSGVPIYRELALEHAINPMTVSKVYSILESEGVLERHRGKPMTVAAQRPGRAPVASRRKALEPHLDNLILAGRQLELGKDELVEALRSRWEKTHG